MDSAGSDGPTDEDLFPSFAECELTPDDLVPDMAERYRVYLERMKDRSEPGDRAHEDRADVPVAAETDGCAIPSEVILEVGAEGGSLTLYGLRTPRVGASVAG